MSPFFGMTTRSSHFRNEVVLAVIGRCGTCRTAVVEVSDGAVTLRLAMDGSQRLDQLARKATGR